MQSWALQEDYLRYKGVFDWNKLYRGMVGWFGQQGYFFNEELYKQKYPETEIEWAAKRKVDDYYLYEIKIKFHMWDLQDVEVVREGEKKVMQSGRMKITFKATVVTDYSGRWDTTPFKKWLEKVYTSTIIKRDIEFKHLATLYYTLYRLHEHAKELLGMETTGNAY